MNIVNWPKFLRKLPKNDAKDILLILLDYGRVIDLRWAIKHYPNIDLEIKIKLATYCAELVSPIWEKIYPNKPSVRECIKATKNYLRNKTKKNLKILKQKHDDVYTDYTNAVESDARYAAYTTALAATTVIFEDIDTMETAIENATAYHIVCSFFNDKYTKPRWVKIINKLFEMIDETERKNL